MANQQQQSEVFYSIVNKEDGPAEILIYDTIGSNSFWEETVSAKSFVKDLKAIGSKKDVIVRINSPGGSVFDGTAIYNALRNHKGNVSVKIDGIALSMASVVAMAGDSVEMADNALMMMHNPRAIAVGDANDMRAFADLLDKSKASLVAAYMSRSNKTSEEVSALMDAETWLTASEAKELGLVDNVTESSIAVAASFDVNAVSANGVTVPKKFAKQVAAFANAKQEDGNQMSTTEPRAATVEELKALAGADDSFVIAQLTVKATLDQAVTALNATLFERVQAAEKAAAEAQAKLEEPTSSGEGVLAIQSSKHGDGSSIAPDEKWGSDPIGFYGSELRKLTDSGVQSVVASKRIRKQYPGLIEAIQATK